MVFQNVTFPRDYHWALAERDADHEQGKNAKEKPVEPGKDERGARMYRRRLPAG